MEEGYDTVVGENGVILSGGQRQRIAIARALIKNSKIILFDEATSALDNSNQEKIKKIMKDLAKDHTVIIVAHRLSTIVDADNILVLSNHNIIAKGTHKDLIKKCDEYKKLYVVANLPYYITTPIIEKIIEDDLGVDKIVIMVQKEVGDRFNAKVGTKDYNSLTVFLNYYFDIKKLMNVSRNSFVPAPNVDSVIIEMDKKKNNYAVENEKLFFNIIRDSFKFKRKNLRNNLKGYDLDKILEILKEYDLDLTVRAENLTIEQFIEISNKLNEE